jgi:hypothetical protein
MDTSKIETGDIGTGKIGTGNFETHGDSLSEYSEWVNGVAARVTAFHGELRDVLQIGTTDAPNYYHAYPFLFWDEFPGVREADASTLAVAGVLYLNHLCLLDDVVDTPGVPQPYKLLLSALLHEEALVQLGTLFAAASPFWAELSRYHREYAAAMVREQTEHTGRLSAFSEAEVFQIAKGKAAHSKMTTAALALLADRPETIAKLSASQDYFNAARQLYDDAKDWKEDYRNRRYSSLLTAALLEISGGEAEGPQGSIDIDDMDALSLRLHYGGHIDRALAQAVQWCDEAERHVEGYRVAGWSRLIQSLRGKVVRLRGDLAAIRESSARAQPAKDFYPEAKSA